MTVSNASSAGPVEPPTAVLETVLYCTTDNEDATRRFYDETLRLHRISTFAYRLGQQVFLLFNADESIAQEEPPPHGATGPVHTCFLVAPTAYEPWKAYLRTNGVELIDEITWAKGIRSFYFEDPAGNVLEIAEGDMWPP